MKLAWLVVLHVVMIAIAVQCQALKWQLFLLLKLVNADREMLYQQ